MEFDSAPVSRHSEPFDHLLIMKTDTVKSGFGIVASLSVGATGTFNTQPKGSSNDF
jgi:hypothetical protein